MPLFKKEKDKKKSIPKDKILKVIKGIDYLDLGEPFGENARRYLTFQLGKMIDNNEIKGTVIIPEGVYISLSSSQVKNIINLITAKGICDLNTVAIENKWNVDIVKLIAKNRINLLYRKDSKVIVRKTASDLLLQKINQLADVDIVKIADEMQLQKQTIKDLLMALIADGKVEGFYVKSTSKFLHVNMLEESLKELISESEKKKLAEIKFSEIAEEYSITEEQAYNILLKLYNSGEIDVQLNLGKKTCVLKGNIKVQQFKEKIPEEERKLEIEDLTQKNKKTQN